MSPLREASDHVMLTFTSQHLQAVLSLPVQWGYDQHLLHMVTITILRELSVNTTHECELFIPGQNGITRTTTQIQSPGEGPVLPAGLEADTGSPGPNALGLKERNKSHEGID